jgi:3-methyl-2-oxobutanoate hydroxymethyltransferase
LAEDACVQAGAAMLVVSAPSAVGATLPARVFRYRHRRSLLFGQVLAIYDAGIQPGRAARFVRNFMVGAGIESALAAYVAAVKDGSFPAPEHCF